MSSDPSSPVIGLHSAQILLHRHQKDHERLLESYNQWIRKREKREEDLKKQIESIKQSSDPNSNQYKRILAKWNHQLSQFQEEQTEVPDPEILQKFPHSHQCQRPAYRKLAFENALQESEKRKQLAEEVYNQALAKKVPSAASRSEETSDPPQAEVENSPPVIPADSSSSAGASKKISTIKRLDAFLTKLESGKSMTKTFAPRLDPGADRPAPSYGRWDLRASRFEPNRGKNPPASSSS